MNKTTRRCSWSAQSANQFDFAVASVSKQSGDGVGGLLVLCLGLDAFGCLTNCCVYSPFGKGEVANRRQPAPNQKAIPSCPSRVLPPQRVYHTTARARKGNGLLFYSQSWKRRKSIRNLRALHFLVDTKSKTSLKARDGSHWHTCVCHLHSPSTITR